MAEITTASSVGHASATREASEPHALNSVSELSLESLGNSQGEMEGNGNGSGSGNGKRNGETKTKNAVDIIFDHWKQVMDHPKAVLDKQRREFISTAIALGYTPEELCEAITGCSYTPHNMGSNERGERYDGLHIIFKDANQIDRFRKNFECPPRPQSTAEKRISANVNAARAWLENGMNSQEVTLNGEN